MSSEDDERGFADTAYIPSQPPPAPDATTQTAASVRHSVQKAAAAGDPQPGSLVGRFVLERKLGEGGMGMVFEANDPDLQRKVALKLLRPGKGGSLATESQQRMLREAQAMAMLQHPNLVTIYEVGTFQHDVFLAMEYVVGTTLEGWLTTGPHLEDKLEVFEQAARALQAVHDAGLVHRDFKPENVMVTAGGVVKVLDLGIARRMVPDHVEEMAEEVERKREAERERDGQSGAGALSDISSLVGHTGADAFKSQLTQAGTIIGTPSYMAPEQLMGQEVGPAADQFSFAIALYEAIAGDRPFGGQNMVEMMANVVANERRPWPEDCEAPPRLRAAIDRGLSHDPAERFASMSAFFEACREGLGLRGQIRFLTHRWLSHGRDSEYLLPEGELLREGRELLALHPQALSEAQGELVQASWQAVRRRERARKLLTFGLAFLLVALVPALWLIERRSEQLERATIAGVSAHLQAVASRVEVMFERDEQDILLMFDQRGVWAPVAEALFELEPSSPAPLDDGRNVDETVGDPATENGEEGSDVDATAVAPPPSEAEVRASLTTHILALNAFFGPVVERGDTISSLMVAHADEAEYLVFDDAAAEDLDPPYRLYNRVVDKARFGERAFQLFFAPSRPDEPRDSWLTLGEPDSRGQPWTGYTPSQRPWFRNAVAQPRAVVTWTEPYLFFVTKDAGVTGSVAFDHAGKRYVLGVDFMLTDLSRVTALGEGSGFHSFVVGKKGQLVALPRDPRFSTLQDVRAFFVGFDESRRRSRAEGKVADAAAQLPRVADLGRPALQAAYDASPQESDEVYSFEHGGATYWAARTPVGGKERGLTLYVVSSPEG